MSDHSNEIDRTLRQRPYALDLIRRCIQIGIYGSHPLCPEEGMSTKEEILAAVERVRKENPDWGSKRVASRLKEEGLTSTNGYEMTRNVVEGVLRRSPPTGDSPHAEPEPTPEPMIAQESEKPADRACHCNEILEAAIKALQFAVQLIQRR